MSERRGGGVRPVDEEMDPNKSFDSTEIGD